MEKLLCVNACFASFWPIVLMYPANALFWNLVSGWKNLKTPPLHSRLDSETAYFACWWCHRSTPRPLAFNLWTPGRLIPTAITMADYMLVFVLQKILSLLTRLVVECESQQQFDLIISPHKRFWFPCTSHFRLLVMFSFSFYCLFVYLCVCFVSLSPFLVNFKCHL